MSSHTKVSVVIPVYNGDKYLPACLDSILGQTLREIEVLCIDDGSTDSSGRILAEYAVRDSRVRLFSSPHAGAFRAREVGVRAACGEYVYFMDADDLLEVGALEVLCNRADRDNLDQIVFGASAFCEPDVSPAVRKWASGLDYYYSIPLRLCGKIMSGMELMDKLLLADRFHVSPPLRLIRMTAVKGPGVQYGFPDATSRADNYFTPISLYYSRRACAISTKYYRRRVRNDSITTGANSERRHFRNMLQVLLGLYRFQPFGREFENPDSTISRFAALLTRSLNHWVWKLAAETRREILSETLASASPDEAVFLYTAALTTIRGLKRRPKLQWADCARLLLRRAWRKLRGRGGNDWGL